ncbi:hypothetical protein EEB14_53510 [Rhodococcus sp. WS4]|nr:hypothetical protein EEB14_53510 [Rhodococcus sp. WS4]
MNVLTLVIQVVVGVLTVSGSYVAARRGARETEVRSRREEWWRRFISAADARSDADAARRQAGEAVLDHLYDSELAGAGERDILLRVQWAAQEAERMRQQGSTPPE